MIVLRFWSDMTAINRSGIFLASVFLIGGLAACVGDLEPKDGDDKDPPSGQSDGRKLFDANVRGYLQGSCVACHKNSTVYPSFLGKTAQTDIYDGLIESSSTVLSNYSDTPLIVTYGPHQTITSTNWMPNGMGDKIKEWLGQERKDRGL